MPIKSRAKGCAYELSVIRLFNSMGWDSAVSSRSESKRTDDSGVDICYTAPIQVQCKAVERLGNYHNILGGMPKKDGHFNVVFHKKNRCGTVVAMSQEDFLHILQLLIDAKVIIPQ